MDRQYPVESRFRRTVNDVVMAELFLIQATLESATAIGEGVSDLGKALASDDEMERDESVQDTLQRIRSEATEPYLSRFRYFRDMLEND